MAGIEPAWWPFNMSAVICVVRLTGGKDNCSEAREPSYACGCKITARPEIMGLVVKRLCKFGVTSGASHEGSAALGSRFRHKKEPQAELSAWGSRRCIDSGL
jgi:hypothetical protein